MGRGAARFTITLASFFPQLDPVGLHLCPLSLASIFINLSFTVFNFILVLSIVVLLSLTAVVLYLSLVSCHLTPLFPFNISIVLSLFVSPGWVRFRR